MADLLNVRDCDRSIPPQQERDLAPGVQRPLTMGSLPALCRYLTGQRQNQIQIREKPDHALMRH